LDINYDILKDIVTGEKKEYNIRTSLKAWFLDPAPIQMSE
jgi:hypothetical protein